MDTNQKLGAAVLAFLAAPFGVLALAFDVPTAWRFVWVAALILVSPLIAVGLTELVAAATEGKLPAWAKVVTSGVLGAVPTALVSPDLAAWWPAGYRGVAVLGLLLMAAPPLLWAFLPALRRGAVAQISQRLGGAVRQKMVQRPGKPPELVDEDVTDPQARTVIDATKLAQMGSDATKPKASPDGDPPTS